MESKAEWIVYPVNGGEIRCLVEVDVDFVTGAKLVHRVDEKDESALGVGKPVMNPKRGEVDLVFSEEFVAKYGNEAVDKICLIRSIL